MTRKTPFCMVNGLRRSCQIYSGRILSWPCLGHRRYHAQQSRPLFRTRKCLHLNRLSLPRQRERKQENQKSFGTGFFVSSEGHIIANSHVVKDCISVQVTLGLAPKMAGRIMAHDAANDLALIKVEIHPAIFASLRSGVRLGEGVAAFGFPLAGLLATSGNFTLGNVIAVAGMGDDTRILQISAPVQPRNSGGPLLDYSGNVVGVVEGKLNAITIATVTNDMAQNVTFAIKANVVTNFLDANSVAFTSGSLASTALQPSEIAERAKSLAVMIECSK
jgi:S1-C subfamily serine protease